MRGGHAAAAAAAASAAAIAYRRREAWQNFEGLAIVNHFEDFQHARLQDKHNRKLHAAEAFSDARQFSFHYF
jgi:hypothetical protein